jgi:hypothetical protein
MAARLANPTEMIWRSAGCPRSGFSDLGNDRPRPSVSNFPANRFLRPLRGSYLPPRSAVRVDCFNSATFSAHQSLISDW